MHVCTLNACGGQSIHLMYESGKHHFYLDQNDTVRAIEQVIADFKPEELSTSQLLKCIALTYPQLVKLDDGTYKLYLRTRGPLGGMMPQKNLQLSQQLGIGDQAIEDAVIADKILSIAPIENRYSSITVQTITNHQFPGTTSPKKVRQIIVQVGNWDWFVNVLKALISEPIYGINTNRAIAAILGSGQDLDVIEMKKAYKKNYKFQIYISYDLQNFYFEPIDSPLTSTVEGLLASCTIS